MLSLPAFPLSLQRIVSGTDIQPQMMVTYMLSFLDKQTSVLHASTHPLVLSGCISAHLPSLNYSNAYGLQSDTHMAGNDSAWVSSALYFGWLAIAYPWQLLLQRHAVGRLIGVMLFVWGAVCMLQAAVHSFAGFFAVRFFLGMLEAVVSPAFVLLTSMLWTRKEQSLRSSFWLSVNGVSSIVGAMTAAWGLVVFFFLPDGPHSSRMLSEHERVVAVWRIARNQTGLKQPAVVRSPDRRGPARPQGLAALPHGHLLRHPQRRRHQLPLRHHQGLRLRRPQDEPDADPRRRLRARHGHRLWLPVPPTKHDRRHHYQYVVHFGIFLVAIYTANKQSPASPAWPA